MIIEKHYFIIMHQSKTYKNDVMIETKQREYYKTYYQVYKERPKYIYQNNYFVPPSKKDFIVSFPSY